MARAALACTLLLLVAVIALATGCAGGSNYNAGASENGLSATADNAIDAAAAYGGLDVAVGMAEAADSDSAANPYGADAATRRKEIKNGHALLDTKDASYAYAAAMGAASALGGYEFDRSESRIGGNVHISLTLKLPPESLAEFEARLRADVGGSITSWDISSEDITSQYYDAAARLESMERSLSQYLELIGEARDVSEILEIRREVTALQADIDSLRGMLRMWDALVAYATFRLEISQSAAPLE
jgi:hypothetical protein